MIELEEHVDAKDEVQVQLKRQIGLKSSVTFMLCYVIGSGIFVTPGTVLEESGSVGMMILVWILCGLISLLACLPFGELSSVVPKSGSVYIYLYTAFNHRHPFFGGLPSFTYFWMMYVIMLPCSIALCAKLFAEYMFVMLQDLMPDTTFGNLGIEKELLGAASLIAIGVINCISVKLYVLTQDWLAYIKMAAIAFIVGCGIYLLISGESLKFDPSFKGTKLTINSLTQAFYSGLYTYDGGCYITGITEEMKHPEKNIMRSILIGLAITTLAYVLLNITFLTALTPGEVATGTTVISHFCTKVFGNAGGAIASIIVCLSLVSGIMAGIFYASRIGYVAAREGHLPEFLCCIQRTTKTPCPAIILQVLLSLCYFFVGGDINILINMYSFFVWLSYGATMTTVFVLRKQLPEARRPFKVPSAIPVLIAIFSAYLFVVAILLESYQIVIEFVISVTLSSLVFYIFIYKKFRIKHFDELMKKLQESLGLVPLSEEPNY